MIRNRPYLVGLTGGIGSGKSTVSAILERLGAVIVDADEISRRVLEPGSKGERRALRAFGEGVRNEQGGIDRQKLARVVFDDASARGRLERIVHSEVFGNMRRYIDELAGEARMVVLDVPLLFETGLDKAVDEVLVVTAPEEVRLERVSRRDGAKSEQTRARMKAQLDDDWKRAHADTVIENAGNLAQLEAAATDWYNERLEMIR